VESVRGAAPESDERSWFGDCSLWCIPAGEIEQLAASRLRQWLLDDGGIYHAME